MGVSQLLGSESCPAGREWQLEQMRKGFLYGKPPTLIGEFLETFSPGPSRQRLVCGQEVTVEHLLGMSDFTDYPQDGAVIKDVLRQLTDDEIKLFFRWATALNSIPQSCTITFTSLAGNGYPRSSTCDRKVSEQMKTADQNLYDKSGRCIFD